MKRKKLIKIIASIIATIAILLSIVGVYEFTVPKSATETIAIDDSSTEETVEGPIEVKRIVKEKIAEKQIVKGQISDASDFDEIGICDRLNQIVVRKNDKDGLIENGGKVIIVPQYDFISPLPCGNGMREFQNDGLWGVLDIEGNVILEPKYEFVSLNEYEGTIQIKKGLTFKTYKIEEIIQNESSI